MFTITPSSALTQPVRSAYDYAEIYGGRCQKLELAMTEYEEIVQRIAVCTLCALSEGRTRTVPGDGSATADIMFIGEAPRAQRRPARVALRRRGGQCADKLACGDRSAAVGCVHYEYGEVPPEQQPRSAERRDRGVLHLPGRTDRSYRPEGHSHAGTLLVRQVLSGTQHQPRAGQASFMARAYDLSDVSSCRYAA